LDASEKQGRTLKLERSEHLQKQHRAADFAWKCLSNPLRKTPRTVLLKAQGCRHGTALAASASNMTNKLLRIRTKYRCQKWRN
jgi:hypothetical protein